MSAGAEIAIEAGAQPMAGGARVYRSASRLPWLRVMLATCTAVLISGAIGLFTYEMALARIPEHRAALERLVRARTGLDVRFNELGVRWGWYGPEVVFSEVELGEPGRSNLLLRASALVVAFDAWRSFRTGQLAAGRITLVSPDIDITRLQPRGAAAARIAAPEAPASPWLARWPNGRVDVEGGTLSVPDPRSPGQSLVLQLRTASLRREAADWSGSASAQLPERLGRSVRVVLQVTTANADPARLTGTVRLEANGVLFMSWRELLLPQAAWAQYLPSAGSGLLTLGLTLRDGHVSSGGGELHATAVALRLPALAGTAREAGRPEAVVTLGAIDTTWRLERDAGVWHVTASDLGFGARARDMPATTLSVAADERGRWLRATLAAAPLESLRPAAAWLVPEWTPASAPLLEGRATGLSLDWQAARPAGARLHLAMSIDGLRIGSTDGVGFEGATARLTGDESQLLAELHGSGARLTLAPAAHALEHVRLASRIELARGARGFRLAMRTALEHERGRLLASGSMRVVPGAPPALALHAMLENADVAVLRSALGSHAAQLGPVLTSVTAGRIPRAELNWIGRLGVPPTTRGSLNGFLVLEDGALSGVDSWPALHALSARLDVRGQQLRATVAHAMSDVVEVSALKARWRADSARGVRVSGQAHGEAAAMLGWLRAHRELVGYAPALRGLDANGPAQFTFSVTTVPPAVPRVRVVARLEGIGVRLAPRLPALQGLRGTLAFDAGHLQRSTLEAQWLGGPALLRIAERGEGDTAGISVQGQGTLGAAELLVACALDARAVALTGRAGWKGELTFAPAARQRDLSWRAHLESSLVGMASRLPAPLAKGEPAALPLRIDADGTNAAGVLRVALGDVGRGLLELESAGDGRYRAARGAVRFGAGPLQLPQSATLDVAGSVPQLDLPAWLAAWRLLVRADDAPPLKADLRVEELMSGTAAYGGARLQLDREPAADVLRIDAKDAVGAIRWMSVPATSAEARFSRLRLPRSGDAGAGAWLAALEGGVRVTVDDLTWADQPLGSLDSRIEASARGLSVRDLRISGPTYAASGALDCGSSEGTCRARFQLVASDAASALQDLGLAGGISAEHASVGGRLEWPWGAPDLRDPRAWLERAHGHLSVALADGAVVNAPAQPGSALPLLGLAQLTSGVRPVGRFARLSGDFEVAEGSLATSNLHFDGDAEILMSGAVGLARRDYDLRAVILSGEDRLPEAVRRLSAGAAPHVAAAWLALRELLPRRQGSEAHPQLHIGGTWEQPRIEPIHGCCDSLP